MQVFYHEKLVRDLVWALESPHFLSDSSNLVLSDSWCQTVVRNSADWLAQLDENPAALRSWLSGQQSRKSRTLALGSYMSYLIEFWLRFCPFLSTTNLKVGQQLLAADGSNQTVGQIKFLFQCQLPINSITYPVRGVVNSNVEPINQIVNPVPGAVNSNVEPANQIVNPVPGAVNSNVEPANQIVNPVPGAVNLNVEPANQIVNPVPGAVNLNVEPINQIVNPVPGATNSIQMVNSVVHLECSVKFFLLTSMDVLQPNKNVKNFPFEKFVGPDLGENLAWRILETCRKLNVCSAPSVKKWLKASFSSEVQSRCILRGYLFYPLTSFSSTIDLHQSCLLHTSSCQQTAYQLNHSKTITNDEMMLSCHHLRGWWANDVAELLKKFDVENRFVILPKLHWLAPIVISKSDVMEGVSVPGEPCLDLDAIDTYTFEDIGEKINQEFQNVDIHSLFVAEISFNKTSNMWIEVSRGFILLPTWDPSPLCGEALRYRKSCNKKKKSRSEVQYRHYSNHIKGHFDFVVDDTSLSKDKTEEKNLKGQIFFDELNVKDCVSQMTLLLDDKSQNWHSVIRDQIILKIHSLPDAIDFVNEILLHLIKGQNTSEDRKTSLRIAHLVIDSFINASTCSGLHKEACVKVDSILPAIFTVSDIRWNYIRLFLKLAKFVFGNTYEGKHRQLICRTAKLILEYKNPRYNALFLDLYCFLEIEVDVNFLVSSFLEQRDYANAESVMSIDFDPLKKKELQNSIILFYTKRGLLKQARRFLSKYPVDDPQKFSTVCESSKAKLSADWLRYSAKNIPALANDCTEPLINHNDILLIDSTNDLRIFDDTLKQLFDRSKAENHNFLIVGMDCEWRPQRFKQNEDCDISVSVLQLSVRNVVFVIDLQSSIDFRNQLWSLMKLHFFSINRRDCFLSCIFGFSIENDLKRLIHVFPELYNYVHVDFATKGNASTIFLEIKKLAYCRHLQVDNYNSLSSLIEVCLRKKICKAQQCSDWGIRPLSEDQIKYAALDAYSVEEVAKFLLADVVLANYQDALNFFQPIQWQQSSSATVLRNQDNVIKRVKSLGLGDEDCFYEILDSDVHQHGIILPQGVIVKTIGIQIVKENQDDIKYAAVVLRLDRAMDFQRLAVLFKTVKKNISLVKEEKLPGIYGYSRGCIGPVGLLDQNISIVLDQELFQYDKILCGAGEEHFVFAVNPTALHLAIEENVLIGNISKLIELK